MGTIEKAEKPCRRLRILVVDDSPAMRHLVGSILAEEGFEVVEAVDGASALGKLAIGVYDAVVSDLHMPGLDGLSLLREIQRSGMGIPVIILTARVDASLEIDLRRAGAFRVLSKGQFGELLQSLADAIGSASNCCSAGSW
jgi:CheY-like chemotaxis protein